MATYDPKLVQASLGDIILGDFGPDTFINVNFDMDEFEAKQGATGSTEWVNKNSAIANIEFTILQTSPINDRLSALLSGDRANNTGAVPFMVKDAGPGGTTLVSFAEARIVKRPNLEFGNSTTNRTWTLKGVKPSSVVIGGME